MQRLESFGLMGTALETAAPLSTAAAAAIVAAAERNAPAPAPKRRRPTRRRVVEPRAASDGITWISESRANADLPPGRYKYRDRRGHIIHRDVGTEACRESLRERRLQRADKTGGYADREIRDGVTVRGCSRFQMVAR
jgi:hypothetical protein